MSPHSPLSRRALMPPLTLPLTLTLALTLALAFTGCTPFKDYTECESHKDCEGLFSCGESQLCEPIRRSQSLPSGVRILAGELSKYTPNETALLALMVPEEESARAHLSAGVIDGVMYSQSLAGDAGLRKPILFQVTLSDDPAQAGRLWGELDRLGVVGVIAAGLRPQELQEIRAVSGPRSPALISLTQEVNFPPPQEAQPYPRLFPLAPQADQFLDLPSIVLQGLNVREADALVVYDERDEAQRGLAEAISGVARVPLTLGTTAELRATLSNITRANPLGALIWLKNSPERDLVDAVSALKDAGALNGSAPLEVITLTRPLGESPPFYNDPRLSAGVNPFAGESDVRVWSIGPLELAGLPEYDLNSITWSVVDSQLSEPTKSALKGLFTSKWERLLDVAATPFMARAVDAASALLLVAERHPTEATALTEALSTLWSPPPAGAVTAVGPTLVSLSEARLSQSSGEGASTLRFFGVGGPITLRDGALIDPPRPHISCRLFSETEPARLVSEFFSSSGAQYALPTQITERCGR
jgi:hypothetical protein